MKTMKGRRVFRPVRFAGVDPIHPSGPERERSYIHPNAVNVWAGRLG